MTRPALAVRIYRHAVRLYPSGFREEYGQDLVRLLDDQLRAEPTGRVMARTVVDLALTLPARHLEAHMKQASTLLVPALFGAVALSSVIVAITVGHPIVAVACLVVAAAAGSLAVVALHRRRPLTQPRPLSAQWWKLLFAGAALLAGLIASTTAAGELAEGVWFFAMITGLSALVLLGAGIVLGIAHLASRTSRAAS